MAKKYNILLLTNRDSDNIGDQVIEACDIALIKAAMKNLGVSGGEYAISSRSGSIVTKKYISTKDEELLKGAEEAIRKSDLVVFGGAPVFNYLYQSFYERTATTLEIARKYEKPVIFSAVGVEQYDELDEKCQRLKETLNFDCVKQITTRDGIEELTKYKARQDLVIARVSDPAVFSAQVFRNFHVEKSEKRAKKRIGVFVFRANGFKDNQIDFDRADAAQLWKDLIRRLEERGYDYTLLTSGHFGDEAFLDYLIREHGVQETKCVFNLHMPENLIREISSYDAVISCRLHPSIISFSLKVPSVGLIWNPKVKHFYECVGYGNRAVEVGGIDADEIVDKVDEVVSQGVEQDKAYLITVYQYLFSGIQRAFNLPADGAAPYDYETLAQNIPAFEGTSEKEQAEKLKRKFRRIYETLNIRAEKTVNLKEAVEMIREVSAQYAMFYHSGEAGEQLLPAEDWQQKTEGDMQRLLSGAMECRLLEPVINGGGSVFAQNLFQNGAKEFRGWCLRFRIREAWFWYLEDGTFCLKDSYDHRVHKKMKLFSPGEQIPYLPFPGAGVVVAEARWKRKRIDRILGRY